MTDKRGQWNGIPDRSTHLSSFQPASFLIEKALNSRDAALKRIRASHSLMTVGDIAGSFPSSTCRTFCWVLMPFEQAVIGANQMRNLRERCKLDTRRIGYKSMSDRRRMELYVPLLSSLKTLPALAISLTIPKSLNRSLVETNNTRRDAAYYREIRKTYCFAIAGLLLGGASSPLQNIVAVHDHDEMFEHDESIKSATCEFASVVSQFLHPPLGHLKFGSTRSDPGDNSLNDLVSIPDLIAGAMNKVIEDNVELQGEQLNHVAYRLTDLEESRVKKVLSAVSSHTGQFSYVPLYVSSNDPRGFTWTKIDLTIIDALGNNNST